MGPRAVPRSCISTLDIATRNYLAVAVLHTVEPHDDVLVAEARLNAEAFGRLYDRYGDAIYNYIRYRIANTSDAEDLTAQTFHRALVSLSTYESRGHPFAAWLYRIAHNLVANWHRRQGRHRQTPWEDLADDPAAQAGTSDDSDADTLFNRQLLLSAMRLLEEDRQALLVYKFSQGLSNAEIAAILGRTEGAIKSLYHRTLSELRAQLNAGPDGATTTGQAS